MLSMLSTMLATMLARSILSRLHLELKVTFEAGPEYISQEGKKRACFCGKMCSLHNERAVDRECSHAVARQLCVWNNIQDLILNSKPIIINKSTTTITHHTPHTNNKQQQQSNPIQQSTTHELKWCSCIVSMAIVLYESFFIPIYDTNRDVYMCMCMWMCGCGCGCGCGCS